MPRQIENPGDPEDYLDGLREKRSANFDIKTDTLGFSPADSGNPTTRKSGVDTGLSVPLRCLIGAALFVAGMATGAVLIATNTPDTTETAQQRTTVSEPSSPPTSRAPSTTRPAPAQARPPDLSPECQRALDGMARYLDSAVNIANANDKQLDILSEAYQAIFLKDWRELNRLGQRQRDLDRSLAADKTRLLPKSIELREDLDKCRSQRN